MAPGVDPPVYFTIQPGAGYVVAPSGAGARIIYPNPKGWAPLTTGAFWHYDPDRDWVVYGQGMVTRDGRQIVPYPGTELYKFTGAMFGGSGLRPGCAGCPPPDSTWPPDGPPHPDRPGPTDPPAGDPVEVNTGLFVLRKTDLVLPDVIPITLTRMYRASEGAIRGFGVGTFHYYEMFLSSLNPYQEVDLILPDSTTVHYVRISPGTGWTDAVLEHTATPTVWQGSKIAWNGAGWDLTRTDGLVFVFGADAPLQAIRDRVGSQVTLTRAGGATAPVTRITSPHGRWIELTYAHPTWAVVTQARDNLGRVVQYEYDGSARLWKVTDPIAVGARDAHRSSWQSFSLERDARGSIGWSSVRVSPPLSLLLQWWSSYSPCSTSRSDRSSRQV